MKKMIALAFLVLAANSAFAATAFFTGRQEMVTTVTNQTGWRCEYNYGGKTFWQVHLNFCPSSIEVQ